MSDRDPIELSARFLEAVGFEVNYCGIHYHWLVGTCRKRHNDFPTGVPDLTRDLGRVVELTVGAGYGWQVSQEEDRGALLAIAWNRHFQGESYNPNPAAALMEAMIAAKGGEK